MAFNLEQERALLALLDEAKVTLSELPAASELSAEDLTLTRQGVVDKSVNLNVLKQHIAPPASTIQAGIVELSSAVDSVNETKAATPKAVKLAYDLAASKLASVPNATTSSTGIVKLNSAINSESITEAATPKAVKLAYDLAASKLASVPNATTSSAGIVKLNSAIDSESVTEAATPKAVKLAYYLAASKLASVPNATTSSAGIVKLNSAIDSESVTEAATPKAVKQTYSLASGALKASSNLADLTNISQALINLGLKDHLYPTGAPIPWPSATPPKGYFKCNGASFDKNRYPELASAYPSGLLPDLRGEFIRGWDDGRNVDTGRTIGSWQNHGIEAHSHTMTLRSYSRNATTNNRGWGGDDVATGPWTNTSNATGIHETRPRNIAYLYIVRAA